MIKQRALLSHPNFEEDFTQSTDASDQGLGAVLTQNSKILGFYSIKLNESQIKYSTIEKEALAIVKALVNFKPMMFGSK